MMDNEQVKKVLVGARGYVARGWCQGELARDSEGLSTGSIADDACKWDIDGAILVATFKLAMPYTVEVEAFSVLHKHTGRPPFMFNDDPDTTQHDVLKLFDKAIEALDGRG